MQVFFLVMIIFKYDDVSENGIVDLNTYTIEGKTKKYSSPDPVSAIPTTSR